MNKYIKKFCQKMADKIIEKMEKANSMEQVNGLFEMGMFLNMWCEMRGI